jgi:cytosine/adenosine deaminase-related metal-dependent hydrolase
VGTLDGSAREEIDARGFAVTPGFVDIHTHYDGQVTWDDRFFALLGPRRDDGADGQLRRRVRAPAARRTATR